MIRCDRMRRLFSSLLLACLGSAALALPASVTVRPGDTLFRISTRTGVSVADIQRLNGLSGTTIRAGQVLRLVGPAGAASLAVSRVRMAPVTARLTRIGAR